MTLKTWTKIAPPSLEFQEDRIHASEFGDSYFQPIKAGSDQSHRATTVEDEIHYTFFGGNDLAKQFEAHANQQFCIAELGLGSGANLSETLRFWQSMPKAPARLDYLAFEARPFSCTQMAQAAAVQRLDLSCLIDVLTTDPFYPTPGISRYQLAPGFWLTLVLGDAVDTLPWFKDQLVNAWYLDGFAPARNHALWSETTLAHVGRMTRPGGSFATFTAASAVRKGLAAAGFDVQKTAGFGPKRERLVGHKPGYFVQEIPSTVTISGAGIMGSWAGELAHEAGLSVTHFDPLGRMNGPGSGVPVPTVDWRPTLDFGRQGRLALTSFLWASRAYQQHFPAACRPGPLTPLEPRIWPTFAHWGVAEPEPATDVWETGQSLYAVPGTMTLDRSALRFDGEVRLAPLPDVATVTLSCLGKDGGGVNSTIRGQQSLFTVDEVLPERPLKVGKLGGVTADGQFFLGSSFDREHGQDWAQPRIGDDHEAMNAFRQATARPERLGQPAHQWSGLRAVSVDRLPNYQQPKAGQWAINALGSHGFTFAPLLAAQWVSDLVGAPNVIDLDLLESMERR